MTQPTFRPLPGFTPASAGDLGALESELGHTLPDDYKAWLGRSNGGYPTPDEWSFTATWQGALSGLNQDMTLYVLYGWREGEDNSIDVQWQALRDRIPKGAIPIGDAVSPVLLLLLDGPERGQVMLWMTDTWPEQDQTRPAHLGLVAKSFGEFINGLVRVAG